MGGVPSNSYKLLGFLPPPSLKIEERQKAPLRLIDQPLAQTEAKIETVGRRGMVRACRTGFCDHFRNVGLPNGEEIL